MSCSRFRTKEALRDFLYYIEGMFRGISSIEVGMDWTNFSLYRVLVFWVPVKGRALPVWYRIVGLDEELSQNQIEEEAIADFWEALSPYMRRKVIFVGDRGLGGFLWLGI